MVRVQVSFCPGCDVKNWLQKNVPVTYIFKTLRSFLNMFTFGMAQTFFFF